MKKKILTILTIAACAAVMTACGGEPAATTTTTTTAAVSEAKAADFDPAELTKAVLEKAPIVSAVEKGVDNIPDYFTMQADGIEAASFYICASGAYPDEIGCIKFADEAKAAEGKTAVEKRIEKQTELFTSYTPDEVYKLEGAVVKQSGCYVYYFACSDNDGASAVADGFFAN